MVASRLMPRSPVWLRKIPSTVSGSQGSRRGLRPAVRFAFPLGAKMYITDFPAPGQGKVRIRADLLRRAGEFRRAVGVFPARAIVTAGALPPILMEEPPQPEGGSGDGRPGAIPPAERAPVPADPAGTGRCPCGGIPRGPPLRPRRRLAMSNADVRARRKP